MAHLSGIPEILYNLKGGQPPIKTGATGESRAPIDFDDEQGIGWNIHFQNITFLVLM